jgi:hypothetical protein
MLIETGKSFPGLQIRVQRQFIGAVHVGLLHLREGGIEVHRAELMDFIIRSRSLPAELIAGNIQNLKTLISSLPV